MKVRGEQELPQDQKFNRGRSHCMAGFQLTRDFSHHPNLDEFVKEMEWEVWTIRSCRYQLSRTHVEISVFLYFWFWSIVPRWKSGSGTEGINSQSMRRGLKRMNGSQMILEHIVRWQNRSIYVIAFNALISRPGKVS